MRLRASRFGLGCVLAVTVGSISLQGRPEPVEWLRASTPEFTIITALDEKRAAARVNEFAQYIAALRSYFGEPTGKLSPLTIVVFARPRDFDEYRPLDRNGKPQGVAGFFVRHETWAVIGVTGNGTDDARHVIFHEGVHWFLNGSEKWMPPWLDEGMAEVFSTFESDRKEVRWGRELRGKTQLLHEEGAIPLRHLLFTNRAELFAEPEGLTNLFYAEAWAFVHYLMFSENRMPRDTARNYVALLTTGTPPEEAFQRAFGRTYRQMDDQLKAYISGGRYYLSRRPLVSVPPVLIEKAATDEVDEALGRLALVGNRINLAIQHGRAMTARTPNDPRGHTLLAMALKEAREDAQAAAEFEIAAQRGATEFRPYFETAYALQNDGAGTGIAMSSDAARRAADLYERAAALQPSFEPSYANLAGVVGLADPLMDADRATLQAGARLYPENRLIQLGLAQIARRTGDTAYARRILASVLASPRGLSAKVDTYARQIQSAWDDEDFFGQVNAFTAVGKFVEALALLDARLEHGVDRSVQIQIASIRPQIESAAAVQRLNAALKCDQWGSARRIIAAILDSDAPAATKKQVSHILEQLEERSLTTDGVTPQTVAQRGTAAKPRREAAGVPGQH